jgi:hypothetical protein
MKVVTGREGTMVKKSYILLLQTKETLLKSKKAKNQSGQKKLYFSVQNMKKNNTK